MAVESRSPVSLSFHHLPACLVSEQRSFAVRRSVSLWIVIVPSQLLCTDMSDLGIRARDDNYFNFSVLCGTRHQKVVARKATAFSVRCEQTSKDGNGLDVWLGRAAMVGFAVAISVEISTGKGLLENFGLTSPLPTVALAVTALVGVLTAVFIFQSASEN
ncbi:hypothetical protein E3N88_08939 [Mikania micrantha]|uniref:Stress enhanced protein 1 n=1 Tax=Mikania micrantha TaxID=192012 RepID=A0A5N6PJZ7_9ASTR|nr:hypothetical protein E3N88_08939 [Mikania micrantha]